MFAARALSSKCRTVDVLVRAGNESAGIQFAPLVEDRDTVDFEVKRLFIHVASIRVVLNKFNMTNASLLNK